MTYPGSYPTAYSNYSPAPIAQPAPPANAGWAVAAVVFFWPLAFSAFTHAFKVYPLWAAGDYAAAQYASDRAKTLGKIAIIVWLVLTVLLVIAYIAMIAALFSTTSHYSHSYS